MTHPCARPPRFRSTVRRAVATVLAAAALPTALACGGPADTTGSPERPRSATSAPASPVARAEEPGRTAGPSSASPASASPAQASPSGSPAGGNFPALSGEVVRKLDGALEDTLKRTGVPGVSVGLWAAGKGSYVRALGVADRKSKARMSPDLYMRIGSETKTFTVTALLTLVDQRKVRLDDPVSRYVDGVPGGDGITLRQLAEMRSGLYNYTDDPNFQKALKADPEREFVPAELLAYAFQHPSPSGPGSRFQYSNTNTVLLGLVIEKASGLPFGDYLQRNVLDPAKLKHTVLPAGRAFPNPHARGYTRQTKDGKEADATNWNPSWAWAAGAMISDQQDLRAWARIVADGTLLAKATQAQRTTFLPTSYPGIGYGLGLFDNHGWVGHNGSLPGYQSTAVYLPAAKATMVVLLNTDTAVGGSEPSSLFAEAITKIVTPDHVYAFPPTNGTGTSPSSS
ncbi:serine hydrolase domain-containing protein [Actinacidiphila glaucinigra]|uniref:serine hydrolase domain-containing protein n=1 Tax=Actinacidiphila glaucinigra TaxID=235986 RepID=UPI002E364AEC|nr:serine hydrolase domain-containing protein [Actinacidiphila glaucinigra]